MATETLQIRMAGESGEGVLSTGELVTQAAARAGYRVLTFKTNPAEIKGGHAIFQVRLSPEPIWAEMDYLDILVAFNEEAYEKNHKELRPGGLMIYDSGSFEPPADPNRIQYAVPMTHIAKNEIKFGLAKNVVAVGVVGALFDLDRAVLRDLLTQKFARKGEDVVAKNLQALEAGYAYVKENLADVTYQVKAGNRSDTRMLLNGNQALSLGFLAAGCNFFAGYPITPASDVMEFMAAELPKMGGTLVQAEDEIAALGMVLGASYAGARAMTATSGPGLSLMVEMLGLASMAELPCVVLDVQRGGPSTGLPTKHEQSDLFLAAVGGHGDTSRIVLAPSSVEDCYDQAINAFNLAEKYQVPVILMSETILATRMTNFERPDLARVERVGRLLYQPSANGSGGYQRYKLTPDGVSPMSLPGMSGGQYVATGLEHNEQGRPRYDAANHIVMQDKRFRKLDHAEKDAPEAFLYGRPDAEIGVITWGSTTGAVAQAVDELAVKGIHIQVLAPKMLWPLPDHQVGEFIRTKRRLAVAECNRTGQLATLIASRYKRDLQHINVYGGSPFKTADLVRTFEEMYEYAR